MPTALATLSPIPSREFWFREGDVVLSCPGPNGQPFLYRIHKFMLARHSPHFADMFKAEGPFEQPLETYEGLPVVPLAEPAVEVFKLLCCLYNAMNGAAFKDDQRPIARYDWLLRMCDKYKIAPLREVIFAQLKIEWPDTLSGWDAREAQIAVLGKQHLAARPSGRVHNMYLDDRLPEPVATIGIARANGLLQLLPAAFYDLARRDPRADWDAFHGITTRNLPANQRMLAEGMRSARWNTLGAQDLLALAAAKERQLQCLRELLGRISNTPLLHPPCTAAQDKLVDSIQETAILTRDPLFALQRARKHLDAAGICHSCMARTIYALTALRMCYWRAIPKIYLLERS
ncbi:hypothetical protein B0H15DRAFT_898482 [Mycena belliarum]|uniref:BTB domain-containing protein n=1 Tax=Mycena belliarum TaxID=1033014 RepID=A0AAD6UG19_9AGAR|nr:hypothetical protein B0H15DRAFT_898482 [Mycena belliae]